MLYNIGYTNTEVIYCHCTLITKVTLLYNTEWQYDHGMAVNYHSKKFYNIGLRCHLVKSISSVPTTVYFLQGIQFHWGYGVWVPYFQSWKVLLGSTCEVQPWKYQPWYVVAILHAMAALVLKQSRLFSISFRLKAKFGLSTFVFERIFEDRELFCSISVILERLSLHRLINERNTVFQGNEIS
jgi:hypothetical protein